MLGDFFDHVSSASFDNTAYFLEKALSSQGEGGTALGWTSELPMTSREGSSFWTQPSPSADQPDIVPPVRGDAQYFTATTPHTDSPSDDVLLAASTLLRNGHPQVPELTEEGSEGRSLHPRQARRGYGQPPASGPPADRQVSSSYTALRPHAMRRPYDQASHQAPVDNSPDAYFPDMSFGPQPSPAPAAPLKTEAPRRLMDVRWGSDASFLDHGYVAAPGQGTEEDVTKGLLQKMEYMVARSGATHTGPPSPGALTGQELRSQGARFPSGVTSKPQLLHALEKENPAGPRKKRRSNSNDDSRLTGSPRDGPSRAKKAKGKAPAMGNGNPMREVLVSDISLKRQKPSIEPQRSGRENLTEEQKRSNHILSEQKRRNLIKQGFDDLCTLVPDLHGGGYSKSAMLTQAADWLEDLLRGNDELRTILASLKARSSA